METILLISFLPLSFSSYPTYEEWKLYFPFNSSNIIIPRSYPTYEEWKLFMKKRNKKEEKGSYPTYEEWKRSKNCSFLYSPASSYPTYEEWKRG